MVLSVCCLFLYQTLLGQQNEYEISSIPPDLIANAHTIVRKEVKKLKIPSTSKVILQYTSATTLLNENSRADVLTIFYNSFKKVSKIKNKIYDANGKLVRELKKSEFKDYSAVSGYSIYEDSRVKAVEVNYSSYPYTIEFEYQITYDKSMYYPQWIIQGYGVAVQQKELIVDVFNTEQLVYTAVNIELFPTIKQEGKFVRYHWEVKNKTAPQKVEFSPPSEKVLPMVLLTPKRFKLGKYNGDMDSWSSFGSFMYQLNAGRDQLPDAMKKKVKELTAPAKTDQEKIDILYRFLQKNTRYVSVQLGVGGWQTFDAKYVDEKKYGDCKALTNYMKSMLKEVGITAYPVLIGSGRSDALIGEDYVYPFFNHVILNVPSEDCWLECTSSHKPSNYIGKRNENRMALRYSEKGGELIKTPDYPAEFNQEKNKAVFTITANGDARIVNEVLFTGTQHEGYRQLKYNKSQEELEEWFKKNESLPSFTVNQLLLEVSDLKPVAKIRYDLSIRKYASKGGRRLFVPLNLLNSLTSVPAVSEKQRTVPVYIKSDVFDEDEFTFNLPEGYEVESLLESYELDTDFGTYIINMQRDNQKVIYTRKLKMKPGEYSAERYKDLRNFLKEVATRDAAKMVLVKKKT